MERVRGVIKSPDGEVIFENVEMHIHETRGRGRRGWRGSISLPGMAHIRTGMHNLVLEDGREASILVNNVRSRSSRAGNRTTVAFVVSGLLAQPA